MGEVVYPVKRQLSGIEFGPRDEAAEEEIKKHSWWYLELCPASLFFYPPHTLKFRGKFEKEARAIEKYLKDDE